MPVVSVELLPGLHPVMEATAPAPTRVDVVERNFLRFIVFIGDGGWSTFQFYGLHVVVYRFSVRAAMVKK